MGTGVNLQRATIVSLCKPVYSLKFTSQVPRDVTIDSREAARCLYQRVQNSTCSCLERQIDVARPKSSQIRQETFQAVNPSLGTEDVTNSFRKKSLQSTQYFHMNRLHSLKNLDTLRFLQRSHSLEDILVKSSTRASTVTTVEISQNLESRCETD